MSSHPDYPRTRLYVDQHLTAGAEMTLTEAQLHYLLNVLRGKDGDALALFNGRDGEWQASIMGAGKKSATLRVEKLLRPQADAADIWLLAAPLKGGRSEWVVEKATELGIARICPVRTQFTVADRVNGDKWAAIAREAAEQCERTTLPAIAPFAPLEKLLGGWDAGRTLIFGDESGAGANARELLPGLALLASPSSPIESLPPLRGKVRIGDGPVAPAERLASPHLNPPPQGGRRSQELESSQPAKSFALLIGPEGGFSPDELALLRSLPYVRGVSLGPRVLRADTAAVAALALLQAFCGDWDGKPAFRGHD